MSNEDDENYFISQRRTFHIQTDPQWKMSLSDDRTNVEINRIFLPIESNVLSEKIIEIQPISFTRATKHVPSTKSPSMMNVINQQPTERKERISSRTTTTTTKSVLDQSLLTPPLSQPIPDSIINDKQTTERIANQSNSTHLSKFITLTPIVSSSKEFRTNDWSSSHLPRAYPMASIFTSTSALFLHENSLSTYAHAATTKPFLSDTIFIFLIATLTLIILLLCLGLFCLCRRTSKRNISPSFDGGSYAGLNGQSFDLPTDDYEPRHSKDENHISFLPNHSSSSIPIRTSSKRILTNNEPMSSSQNLALHRTIRSKYSANKKLKKKRIGFCCCKSQPKSTMTVNARTRP